MARFYDRIDRVVIKGEIRELTRIVTQMGKTMQDASSETEAMKVKLLKYMSSNLGKQYDKAAAATLALSESLYTASVDVNQLQNDIVDFQNKSFRFEEMSEYAAVPSKHLVQKANVQVIKNVFHFGRDEMMEVAKSLHAYCANLNQLLKIMVQNVNDIGKIWADPIYARFKDLIYDLVLKSTKHIDVLNEYATHLDMKIKEYQ